MEWQRLVLPHFLWQGLRDPVAGEMVGVSSNHYGLMTNAEILGGRLLPLQDLPLYRLVEETCWRWAAYSRYPLKRVEPIRNHCDTSSYGWYNRVSRSVNIGIRFSFQGRWRANPHSAYNILDSVAHELAHFQAFNHGKKHTGFSKEILQDILDDGMLVEFQKLRHWLLPEERYQ